MQTPDILLDSGLTYPLFADETPGAVSPAKAECAICGIEMGPLPPRPNPNWVCDQCYRACVVEYLGLAASAAERV